MAGKVITPRGRQLSPQRLPRPPAAWVPPAQTPRNPSSRLFAPREGSNRLEPAPDPIRPRKDAGLTSLARLLLSPFAKPASRGAWTAPDERREQRLVAAGGGMPRVKANDATPYHRQAGTGRGPLVPVHGRVSCHRIGVETIA